MRRQLLTLAAGIAAFLLLILWSSVVYAQDGGAEGQSALSRVTEIAFQILTPILAMFAMWAAHRLLAVFEKKSGVDIPEKQERLIGDWVRQGIHRAEEWSRNKVKEKTDKLTGPEKLEISANFVLDLIEAQNWTGWTADRIKDKVEAILGIERAIGVMSAASARPVAPPLPPNVV